MRKLTLLIILFSLGICVNAQKSHKKTDTSELVNRIDKKINLADTTAKVPQYFQLTLSEQEMQQLLYIISRSKALAEDDQQKYADALLKRTVQVKHP